MPAKYQRKDKKTGQWMPSERQRRAIEVRVKYPEKSLYECLILAGYKKNTALNGTANFIDATAVKNVQELYGYELARQNVTPRLLAKRMREGVKNKDLRLAFQYIQEAKKDLGISKETPDTAIQINLQGELNDYAT
jgi:hypothetical protein